MGIVVDIDMDEYEALLLSYHAARDIRREQWRDRVLQLLGKKLPSWRSMRRWQNSMMALTTSLASHRPCPTAMTTKSTCPRALLVARKSRTWEDAESHDGHYTSPPVETKLGGLFIVGQLAAAIPYLPLKLCFPGLTTIR